MPFVPLADVGWNSPLSSGDTTGFPNARHGIYKNGTDWYQVVVQSASQNGSLPNTFFTVFINKSTNGGVTWTDVTGSSPVGYAGWNVASCFDGRYIFLITGHPFTNNPVIDNPSFFLFFAYDTNTATWYALDVIAPPPQMVGTGMGALVVALAYGTTETVIQLAPGDGARLNATGPTPGITQITWWNRTLYDDPVLDPQQEIILYIGPIVGDLVTIQRAGTPFPHGSGADVYEWWTGSDDRPGNGESRSCFSLAAKPNGKLELIFAGGIESVSGVDYARVYWAEYSGGVSGTWSTALEVPLQATIPSEFLAAQIITTPTNRTVIVIERENQFQGTGIDVWVVTIPDGGVFQSVQIISTGNTNSIGGFEIFGATGYGCQYTDSSAVSWLAIPLNASASPLITVYIAAEADDPAFSITFPSGGMSYYSSVPLGVLIDCFAVGTTLYAIWCEASGLGPGLYYASWNGSVWTTNILFATLASATPPYPVNVFGVELTSSTFSAMIVSWGGTDAFGRDRFWIGTTPPKAYSFDIKRLHPQGRRGRREVPFIK